MTELFIAVLNMSITAAYIGLAVILIRLPLKKLPKVFSYVLWLPVGIRLFLNFSFSSGLSFLNLLKPAAKFNSGTINYIPVDIGYMNKPGINSGAGIIDNSVNSLLPSGTQAASINPLQVLIDAAAFIWVTGIVVLLFYSIYSYVKIRIRINTATLRKDRVFETDRIDNPFVFGLIRPKILIPAGLGDCELEYVLAHERTHIKRLDYLIKPFAFLLLIIHWFNPVIWVSYFLMCRDMEMSCDESVLRKIGSNVKSGYAKVLLSFSMKRSGLQLASPLAFGESSIKVRIKNILAFKKPAIWLLTLIIVLIAALMTGLTANPKASKFVKQVNPVSYNAETLFSDKTQYVGNNSKVIRLIDDLPMPQGISRDYVELKTEKEPYGIVINLRISNPKGIIEGKVLESEIFCRNAILMFSLIDNVQNIQYGLSGNSGRYNNEGKYGIAYYANAFTRQNAEDLIGCDVRKYSASPEALKGFISKLNKMSFDKVSEALGKLIEKNLMIIISSPLSSSNPYDYIKAHRKEYESILKQGDKGLEYLLTQFRKDKDNGLKEYIMMVLCKELLGSRNKVTDSTLSPQEWFSRLVPYKETKLPDFKGHFKDGIEQLVYDAAVKKYSRPDDGFTVVAPTIFGRYEDVKINKLVVFATVYSNRYKLYGKTLSEVGGSVVPAALVFSRNKDKTYTLAEYLEAKDGSYFSTSIKEFTRAFKSEKLYNMIMKDYGNNKKRSELLMKNLIEHLKENNQKGIVLKLSSGKSIPLT